MYLVVNLGLKSIRGIVFDDTGTQIYAKAFPVHTTIFGNNVEQDATEWLQLLERILSDLQSNTSVGSHIERITVTTSSSCIVGLDSLKKPATKVLMVSDKRSKEICEELATTSKSDVAEFSASSIIPKILWFKRNEPETFETVECWVNASDLLTHFFTGRVVTDPLNAGKAFYDGKEYDTALLEECGLSEIQLPTVCEIGEFIDIKPELIGKYNFSRKCKFVLTTYDAICAVIGSSNGQSDNACDVSGTVTSVRLVADADIKSAKLPLLAQPVSFLKRTVLGASNNMGGGIIEWYKQAFFQSHDDSVYSTMGDQANASSPGAGGLIMLPYLMGERAPFVNHNASATFFGISRASKQMDFSRAVFEATAYVTNDLINIIEGHGATVNTVTVSGGLARFDLINQIKSDVIMRPVYVTENFESTSTGALIFMLLADQKYTCLAEASSDIVKTRMIIEPSARRHEIYLECFALYKELNEALASSYERQNALKGRLGQYNKEIIENL
jgi:sugar (pentulose or hexulose) kinase